MKALGAIIVVIALAIGIVPQITQCQAQGRAPLALAGSALVLSIPLTTPYAYDYDLVMLLLPLAWLVLEARATGFRRGEAALLVAAWAVPVAGTFVAEATRFQPAWLILLLLLLATWRRAALSAPSARS